MLREEEWSSAFSRKVRLYKMDGICPPLVPVPLLFPEELEKVKTVPSGVTQRLLEEEPLKLDLPVIFTVKQYNWSATNRIGRSK